ncbi:MAG: hypothetical protein AAEJ47_10260 [Planctomycetota bacterium]
MLKIDALGHSAFIARLSREDGSPFQLLADPWLDDHVIGDVGGRFPRVRPDWSELGPIDCVWISHSHTDHLCPYSLLALHRELQGNPRLLIPVSLSYLEDIFEEFLPDWPITILEQEQPMDLGGIRAHAFFNVRPEVTNEDDCMVLLLENGKEALLSEADAVLPMEDPGTREMVGDLLLKTGPEQRVFLTTRNELEATMASVDAPDLDARRVAVAHHRTETTLLAESEIIPNGAEVCPWSHEGTVRVIIGQGISIPHEVVGQWNHCLFPVRISDRARIEQEAAMRENLPLKVLALHGGESVVIEEGEVRSTGSVVGLEVLDLEQNRSYDENCQEIADFPVAPLREDERDTASQHVEISRMLQERYLPYLIGQRQPAIEHRITDCGGEYRIRVRYGSSTSWLPRDYTIDHTSLRFEEAPVDGDAHEEYWGNDLEDYFRGIADDFSTFCRSFPGGISHEFWDCLGMPFLNNDLVERKIRFHFERAQRGESAGSFVIPLWDFAR